MRLIYNCGASSLQTGALLWNKKCVCICSRFTRIRILCFDSIVLRETLLVTDATRTVTNKIFGRGAGAATAATACCVVVAAVPRHTWHMA